MFLACQPMDGGRYIRAVAQGFSVQVWGTWGRRFKSGLPDTVVEAVSNRFVETAFLYVHCLYARELGVSGLPTDRTAPTRHRHSERIR